MSKKKGEKLKDVVEESEATTDESFELIVAPHNFFDALKKLCSASDELIDANATSSHPLTILTHVIIITSFTVAKTRHCRFLFA